MSEPSSFGGFSRETVRFFRDLKRNNNRDWFERNRKTYENEVLVPAKLFVEAMGPRLKKIAPGLIAVPKVNKSIFRLNRDTRFSLDPTPYKTNLGIFFWDAARPKMESAGFYFQLEPPAVLFSGGMYMIPDALLGRYRDDAADPKRGAELRKIVAGIRALPGYTVEGTHYKRVPAGFDPNHPNAELLKHKGIYGGIETKIPEEFYSSAFIDYAFEKFVPIRSLHRWLVKLIR